MPTPLAEWTTKDWGLAVFLFVWTVNGLGIAFDAWLLASGYTTISEAVWSGNRVGLPILAWQQVGFAGLAVHFYG